MYPKRQGLYDPAYEHDACGVGFVVNINGKRDHEIIDQGIQILCNLEHRGAVGGDLKSGDGAGMLMQIPDQFFRNTLEFDLPQTGKYGVGFLFLPEDEEKFQRAQSMITEIIEREGTTLRGYRHAQTFEAIGLDEKFVDTFFPGTFSRIGGVGLSIFEKESIHRHFRAFNLSENGKNFAAGDASDGASLIVQAIQKGRQAAKAINEYLTLEEK